MWQLLWGRKGGKSPQWWQEGKQDLWWKETVKAKRRHQQRDGLGAFMSKAESSFPLLYCCKGCEIQKSTLSPEVSVLKFSSLFCFSFYPWPLSSNYAWEVFLISFSLGFLLFYFVPSLFIMVVLFGSSPGGAWSSGPFRSDGQCRKALVTSASYTLGGIWE